MSVLTGDPDSVAFAARAGRFAAAVESYFRELQGAGAAAPDAARRLGDFLRAETMEFFRLPWSADRGPGGVAAAAPSPNDHPALGLHREHQLRWQRTADSTRRMSEAQQKLLLMWSDALREAAGAFAGRLQPPPPEAARGAPDFATLRGLYDSWIDCAEEAYARMAHGDSFAGALADYVNASSAWRAESRAGIEEWAKALDLPTRSELNALLRRVIRLEEELRTPRSPASARGKSPRTRSPTRRAKRP